MGLSILVLRSQENLTIMPDLRSTHPQIAWHDGPMPFLPGRGESAQERSRLLETIDGLYRIAPKVDGIMYARAYGAFSDEGRAALTGAVPKPLVTAPGAVLDALRATRATRVYVLTPYGQKRHDFEVAWLAGLGYDIVASACLGRDDGHQIAEVTEEMVAHGLALAESMPTPPDAVYVACTIMRTLNMPGLRRHTGSTPIITATSALVGQVLQKLA